MKDRINIEIDIDEVLTGYYFIEDQENVSFFERKSIWIRIVNYFR